MLLQPRHFKYKKRQKKRSLLHFNNNPILTFGECGLLLLRPIHLTAHHMFRYKLFLKRATRRSDKTRRFFWFNVFPHLPLTKKPDGLRMGKGKGKLDCWFTNIVGGVILCEFRNLRPGRASYFMKQLTFKLGIPTKVMFSTTKRLISPMSPSTKTLFKTFW